MKLMVITDSYPPDHSGGYELRCQDVLDRLVLRGHTIEILTTRCLGNKLPEQNNLHRRLNVETPSTGLARRIYQDYQDIKFIDQRIRSFQPDLVYIWHVINLSKAIFPYLSDIHIPIVFDEGGKGLINSWKQRGAWYYFVDYHSTHRVVTLIKPAVVQLVRAFSQNRLKQRWSWPKKLWAYFNSDFALKQSQAKGVPTRMTRLIYSGIDTDKFALTPRTEIGTPVKILVPGRIEPDKGTIDAVLLLAKLREFQVAANLTIVGKVFNNEYDQEIQNLILGMGLGTEITVLPMQAHLEMITLYQQADICFFPSRHPYGLSRVPLEAAACGCLVFTYGNEGSKNIVVNDQNGFLVNKGDYEGIALQILGLYQDPEKYREIVRNARRYVTENHSLDRYVDKIEMFLHEVIDANISEN